MPHVCAPSPMAVSLEYYGREGREYSDVDIEQNTREKCTVTTASVTMGVRAVL